MSGSVCVCVCYILGKRVNIITATTPFFLPFHSEIMMMMIFVFELEFGGYNRPSVHPSVHLSDVSEGGENPKRAKKNKSAHHPLSL